MKKEIAELLDLSGQVALVTGASRGIGRAIALLFAAAGSRVALASRSERQLQEVAAEIVKDGVSEGDVLVVPMDVAVESDVNGGVQRIDDTWGRIDVLVNNAGLIEFAPVDRILPDAWDRVISCQSHRAVSVQPGGGANHDEVR